MNILVLNAGSSSQKMSFFKMTDKLPDSPQKPDWETKLDVKWQQIGPDKWMDLLSERLSVLYSGPNRLIDSKANINVVGHRVVHGGTKYLTSVRIDDKVKADIENLEELAPLHNRINLNGILAIEKLLPPGVPQVATFDTAFHRTLPLPASLYPVPYDWYEKYGIHKFGFHGINHQYCAQRAAQMLNKPLTELGIIVCHLGSGCSLSAIEKGKSVDTTMGFTPLDGLMMSTRSGSVDPGILLHMLDKVNLTPQDLDRSLNELSGLKGVSGLSGDMAQIIDEMNRNNEKAKLAFDMYCYRVRRSICEMRAALSRFDVLVFTAGVGENAISVRQSVCEYLDFLGVQLDGRLNLNTRSDGTISSDKSKVAVLIINAREDWAIATECWRLLGQRAGIVQ